MTWRWVGVAVMVGAVGCHSKIDIIGEDAATGRDARPPSDSAIPPDGTAGCPGPAPKCYQGWSRSSDCCLEPGTEATCEADRWTCPADTFFEAECGRIDPVCEGVDMGRPPLYDDCGLSSDCILTGRYCCPTCGEPTAADYAAINETYAEDYYLNEACPEARDGEVLCPECAEGYNPHLAAYCDVTGFRPACAVLDLEEESFRTCSGDGDCKLAVASCCECGTVSELDTVAVRADLDVSALLCDDGCDCEPTFPDGVSAACVTGQCTVLFGSRTDP